MEKLMLNIAYKGTIYSEKRLLPNTINNQCRDAKIGDFILNYVKSKKNEKFYKFIKIDNNLWIWMEV